MGTFVSKIELHLIHQSYLVLAHIGDLNRKILFGNYRKRLNIYQDTSTVNLDK
jgi:hypothetical protein